MMDSKQSRAWQSLAEDGWSSRCTEAACCAVAEMGSEAKLSRELVATLASDMEDWWGCDTCVQVSDGHV